jgi:hypothetical protein
VQVNGQEAWRGEISENCTVLQESWRQTADPFLAHSAEVVVAVPR